LCAFSDAKVANSQPCRVLCPQVDRCPRPGSKTRVQKRICKKGICRDRRKKQVQDFSIKVSVTKLYFSEIISVFILEANAIHPSLNPQAAPCQDKPYGVVRNNPG
jgi:hypothetical protein